jgi:hypothetical protein
MIVLGASGTCVVIVVITSAIAVFFLLSPRGYLAAIY